MALPLLAVGGTVLKVVGDVLVQCSSILEAVDRIQKMREGWCSATEVYELRIEELRDKITFYEGQVSIHGLPADSRIVQKLGKIEPRVHKQEMKLRSMEDGDHSLGYLLLIWTKLNMTFFPKMLERIIQEVIEEIDKIPASLKMETEIARVFQEWSKSQAINIIISNNDGRYVPILKTQNEVIAAVQDLKGPGVILLHGGAGKGKSVLARYLCLLYGTNGPEKRNYFEHVIMVRCNNSSAPGASTKQFEMLQQLPPTSLGVSPLQKQLIPEDRIADALRVFFRGKTILMILDDVSDRRFLIEMWSLAQGDKRVKYLVTSQKRNLCDNCLSDHCLPIGMEDPTEDEAKQMLASLVGLKNKIIPRHLQEIAGKMINCTDRNPLALACLATNFSYSSNKTNIRIWKDTWRNLNNLLDDQETAIVLWGGLQDVPRSLWAAMKLCINSLETKDAELILLLMYACKGGRVPEAVLRILHERTTNSKGTFVKSRDELKMRELMEPASGTLAPEMSSEYGREARDDEEVSKAWSLRSLVKLYMERHMAGKEEIKKVTKDVLVGGDPGADKLAPTSSIQAQRVGDRKLAPTSSIQAQRADDSKPKSEKARVAIALCGLYFDPHHIDKVVVDVATSARKTSNISDSSDNDLRRKAIEPIIWLLDQEDEANLRCARKVFLKYICEQQLDDDNVSTLLKSCYPSARFATLKALLDIFTIEKTSENTPLLSENTRGLLKALVALLSSIQEGVQTSLQRGLQETAAKALVSIAWTATRDEKGFLVADTPDLLKVVARLLQNRQVNPNGRSYAASILSLLAHGEDEIKLKIISQDGILKGLVNSLSKDHNKAAQFEAQLAALTFQVLASSQDYVVRKKIVTYDGVLTNLIKSLSKRHNPALQELAAGALEELADTEHIDLVLMMKSQDGILASLRKCSLQEDNPNLQERAEGALRCLQDCQDMEEDNPYLQAALQEQPEGKVEREFLLQHRRTRRKRVLLEIISTTLTCGGVCDPEQDQDCDD